MKKINVAVIGACGWIGGVHSECWKRADLLLPDADIVLHTAVDIAEDPVKATAAQYGFAHWSTDYQTAIDDPEVDVIDICCSNSMHRDVAVKAAQAGKSILCEKPLAISVDEAEDMVKAVQDHKVPNRMNFMYRKYPSVAYVKELLDSGRLGAPRHLRINFEQDVMCSPDFPYSWRLRTAESGGGVIVTLGSHILDVACYLMGDVDRVAAESATHIKERPIPGKPGETGQVDVDDMTTVILKYKSGATGELHASWMTHGRKHHMEFELVCSDATVCFNSERMNEIAICEGDSDPLLRGFKTILVGSEHPYGSLFNIKTGMGIGTKESFVMQMYDFVRDILDGTVNGPDFHDGLIDAQNIAAIQKAAADHIWVSL